MPFKADTLKYRAYTYATNKSPITSKEQTIKLVKKANGYGVQSKNVLIKVHSASLNPVDLLLYNSAYKPLKWIYGEQGIGRDYSGVVADIGEKAASKTGLKVGDEVVGFYRHPFGRGTVAEYIELDPTVDKAIVKKPKNLSFTEASSFPLVYGTAYLMMKQHDVKGKKVLVLGGSTSVGKYIVQLAKIRGAKVIVTSNSPRSNDLVKKLGSTNQIDYTKNKNLLNPVLESVKESGKFDYIYDTCGNSDLFSQISSVLAPKSTGSAYITCVGDGKYDYGNIHLLKVVYENFWVTVRSLKAKLGLGFNFSLLLLEPELEWIQDAKNNFEQGNLEVFIDSVHKWDNFNDAVDKIKYNKANGKVVVETDA